MVEDQKRLGTVMKNDRLTNFSDGERDELAVRMIGELVISKHPEFKWSNILESGVLMERRKEE